MAVTRLGLPCSLLVLALVGAVSVNAAGMVNRCAGAKTHPFVGFKGRLSTLEHNVAGEVEIIDDCSFRVTGFSYDGRAPAAYWWGGRTSSRNDLSNGFRLSDTRLTTAANRVEVTVELRAGQTWDQIAIISVWCESFAANFGDVVLARAATSAAAATTAMKSAAAPGPAVGMMVERGSAVGVAAAPDCATTARGCVATASVMGMGRKLLNES